MKITVSTGEPPLSPAPPESSGPLPAPVVRETVDVPNWTSSVGGTPVGRVSAGLTEGTAVEPTAVLMADAIVPVADGSGMGGAAPVERSSRIGPGFQVAVWMAAVPPTVKVTGEPSRAQPGR